GQIPDEAAGRVGPQARGEAGGGRLTRDALASSGADICDSARRWDTTPTPQQQGPPPTRSSASCGRGWMRRSAACMSPSSSRRARDVGGGDHAGAGAGVSERGGGRGRRRVCSGGQDQPAGGWLRIRPKGTHKDSRRQNLTSKQ